MFYSRVFKRELTSSLQVLMVMALGSVLSSTCTFLLLSPSLPERRFYEMKRSLARDRLHDQHESFHKEESEQADKLAEQVRILCLVTTMESNHEKKAAHLKNTWGRRCNKLIFMSTKDDPLLGAIDVDVPQGKKYQWGKAKASLKYVFDHHFHAFDWVFVAQEDTYAIIENLRYMLSVYDPEDPLFFGSRIKSKAKQGSVSRNAGYVLSKSALRKFVKEAMTDRIKCNADLEGSEEIEIGVCLENVGVKAGDSRDSLGRGRFFPCKPDSLVGGKIPQAYKDSAYYSPSVRGECQAVDPSMRLAFHLREGACVPSTICPLKLFGNFVA
ncbi:glycoprotein-N-acetylgalactosamine 3-beta-galactosyltransferase 1-like isoform X2 [Penaeus chinensis]|uniref:glycoprotein-N-acetylgalactosamine 3-beta-galactosyltransferase 1-like isoform X2 n=1 Tax=Penaeus chinensis TaxID=139456 RepID=UPI001FB73EE4|nr:glycoprotein-N-acetylgalactosamine 3-beta-galactosyltransferase 1-like isoform X2 [Penaeus chinensis]